MDRIAKIGIIGDFDPTRESQIKTNESLIHASKKLSFKLNFDWIPTKSLNAEACESNISTFGAIWAGPGDHEDPKGVISAIQYCREKGKPFLGT